MPMDSRLPLAPRAISANVRCTMSVGAAWSRKAMSVSISRHGSSPSSAVRNSRAGNSANRK